MIEPTIDNGVWGEVDNITKRPASSIATREIPTSPGIYVWFYRGEPVYVGQALGKQGLRGRLRSHLAKGPDLSRSTLRASVAVAQLGIDRATARRRPTVMESHDIEAVNSWLGACDLGWIECPTASEAHAKEVALRSDWLPPLNRI